jgi:hypothetical protein
MRIINPQLIYEFLYLLLLILCVLLAEDKYSHLLTVTYPTFEKIWVSLLCLFLYFFWLIKLKVEIFERIFLTCFRLASVYPILVFYFLYSDLIQVVIFSSVFYLALHSVLKIRFLNNLDSNKVFPKIFVVNFLLIISGIFIGILVLKNGLPTFSALNFNNIYEVRSLYNSSRLVALFQSFVTFFVVPYFIFNLSSGFRLIIPFLISFFVFLISGGKFVLAMFIVFVGLRFILINFTHKHLPLIFILPLLISVILLVTNNSYMSHFLFFRPFMTPAWVTFEYFKFSIDNGYFYYSEHFFTSLFTNSTHLPTAVGWQMFPNSGTYANAGSIAYSYVNTGWFLVVEVGFIAMTIKTIAFIGKTAIDHKDKQFVMAIMVFVGLYLGTTSILTMLKTRVLIVSIVAMFVFIKRKNK